MRPSTVVFVGFAVALGCSSDVDTVDGTGGAGAGTTATNAVSSTANVTVSTSASSTTSGSAQSTASSTSSGGGNICEQGCAHILKCTGFDACAMGVDCMNPMFDCPMGCVNDASCEDIIASAGGNPPPALAACLQGCQGQGGGGGGGGGGDCQGCVFQNDCASPCINDNECIQGWGPCAQNCTDPACFNACDAMFPESAMVYQQVYDCACMACDTECGATMDPCN
jgi:hypothetical protein